MARRIVAFLDVLGFKSLVETVEHDKLVEIYSQLQATARLQTTTPVFPDDHRRFDADAYYEDHEVSRRPNVHVAMASDSIVVYSRSDGYEDALAVVAAARALLLAGFRHGIPLRGGIAVGDLDEVDFAGDALEGTGWTGRFAGLVGLALVRAYELEANCHWSGAVLHPELIEHLNTTVLEEFEDGPFTALTLCASAHLAVETDVPKKSRGDDGEVKVVYERGWSVNWPFMMNAIETPLSESQVADAFASFERAPDPGAVAKRDETLAFVQRAATDAAETFAKAKAPPPTD